MRTSSSPTSSRRTAARGRVKEAPVAGLPTVSYYPPIVATLLTTLVVVLIMGLLTLFALNKVLVELNKASTLNQADSIVNAGFCGVLTLIGGIATIYFITALIKGIRDLGSPIHYARGTMLDKRILGGRKTGNWMGVGVRYAGPDLQTAQTITDEQYSASPDRSKMLQPRFGEAPTTPARTKRPNAYLPTDRIAAQASTSDKPPDPSAPRVIYRVDPSSFETIEPDEEVLIAHSRHLQHIFYVAHLRGGDWESWRNKQLI